MSRVTIPYIDNDERKWAIWSTFVDDIIVYDMTAQQLIEFRAEEAAKKARKEQAKEIIQLQNNKYQHERPLSQDIAEKARIQITEQVFDEK